MANKKDQTPLQQHASPYRPVIIGAVLVLIFLATRFLDLARQSPWVDELANWEWALEDDPVIFAPLTIYTQKLFLSLNPDSLYLLRLPSALIWGFATLLIWFWSRALVGRMGALAVAACLVFSPIALNYSQDANHYHFVFLAGVLSLIAVERLACRPRPDWIPGIVALLGGLLCIKAQPIAVLPLIAAAAAIPGGWAWRGRGAPAFGLPQRTRRMLWGAACLAIFALGMTLLTLRLIERSAGRASVGGYEFNLAYNLKLLADLTARLQSYGPTDVLFAVIAVIVACSGWIKAIRKYPRLRPFALMLPILVLLHPYILGLFQVGHLIYSRYFLALLPPIVLGWGFFLRWELMKRRGSPAGFYLAVGGAALYLLHFALFAGSYYGGDFMPYQRTLHYLDQNMEDEDVVVTYNRYHSRATAFYLRHVEPELNIHHVALDFYPGQADYFIQQIMEVAEDTAERGGKAYYFHYDDGEHLYGPYNQFLEREAELKAIYRSRAQSDLTPLRRHMYVREMLVPPAVESPVATASPRHAVRSSSRFPTQRTNWEFVRDSPTLYLQPYSSVTYRFRAESDGPAVIRFRGIQPSPTNAHPLLLEEGKPVWCWPMEEVSGQFALVAPLGELQAGRDIAYTIVNLEANNKIHFLEASLLPAGDHEPNGRRLDYGTVSAESQTLYRLGEEVEYREWAIPILPSEPLLPDEKTFLVTGFDLGGIPSARLAWTSPEGKKIGIAAEDSFALRKAWLGMTLGAASDFSGEETRVTLDPAFSLAPKMGDTMWGPVYLVRYADEP